MTARAAAAAATAAGEVVGKVVGVMAVVGVEMVGRVDVARAGERVVEAREAAMVEVAKAVETAGEEMAAVTVAEAMVAVMDS